MDFTKNYFKKNKILYVFILTLNSCYLYNYKETTFKVVNETAIDVDSVVINLPNFKASVSNISAHSKKEITVLIDSLVLNNHDFSMTFSAHFRGAKTVLYGSDYNDLSGFPDKKYTITINNNSLRLKICE